MALARFQGFLLIMKTMKFENQRKKITDVALQQHCLSTAILGFLGSLADCLITITIWNLFCHLSSAKESLRALIAPIKAFILARI